MTMKKNVLALAVSGGLIAAPMAAVAEPEVYGLIDIGLESYTDSDGANTAEIFNGFNSVGGNSDARDFTLSNGMTSRLGVRGEEEINDNLTASYNLELQMDVLDDGRNNQNTRLGWAALGGDWGKVKVGSQWQALYEFGGWNTHRTDVHGYGSYYYATSVLNSSTAFGFRQDSAISYEYGSAWGHSDPFAAQVTLGVGSGSAEAEDPDDPDDTVTAQNEEGITSVQAAAQYSFNQRVSVNAVLHQEFSSYTDPGAGFTGDTTLEGLNTEPMLINVGGRWNVTDALELAINYTQVDLDNEDDDKRDALAVASFMDFGNGLSGHLGFANGSDDRSTTALDTPNDIDLNTYGYVKQALSDRTSVRLELENIQYDTDDDSSATVALIGMQHNF